MLELSELVAGLGEAERGGAEGRASEAADPVDGHVLGVARHEGQGGADGGVEGAARDAADRNRRGGDRHADGEAGEVVTLCRLGRGDAEDDEDERRGEAELREQGGAAARRRPDGGESDGGSIPHDGSGVRAGEEGAGELRRRVRQGPPGVRAFRAAPEEDAERDRRVEVAAAHAAERVDHDGERAADGHGRERRAAGQRDARRQEERPKGLGRDALGQRRRLGRRDAFVAAAAAVAAGRLVDGRVLGPRARRGSGGHASAV
mmetsp:Transcript_16904/g.57201  ORF Transcript_16904/g.57201 Transcript_16904/m.57201 type:complete len:262 (+) Transcript_16904:62-847(+)